MIFSVTILTLARHFFSKCVVLDIALTPYSTILGKRGGNRQFSVAVNSCQHSLCLSVILCLNVTLISTMPGDPEIKKCAGKSLIPGNG